MTNKILWMYWENRANKTKAPYLDLCLETIQKHLGSFELKLLNEKTIHHYIDLPSYVDNLVFLANKSDYIRVALLQKYGGAWLDSDCILLRDIDEIVEPYLSENNYIAVQDKVVHSSFVASTKQGKIISHILIEIQNVLKNAPLMSVTTKLFLLMSLLKPDAKPISKNLLNKNLIDIPWLGIYPTPLIESCKNYPYYAHHPRMFGLSWSRHKQYYLPVKDISPYLANNPFGFFLYNSGGMGQKLQHKSRAELLGGDSLLSQLFRLSLEVKN